MNQPIELIQRKMLRRYFEQDGNYKYRWLTDCILYPELESIMLLRQRFIGTRIYY